VTIADNTVKKGPEKLAALFNGVIRCLAQQAMFSKCIDVSLNATDDEATPEYNTAAGAEPGQFAGMKEVVILDTEPGDEAELFLKHHLKRSEAGVRVHAYLVFTCMTVVTTFRHHRQAADEAERRGEETGIGRFRRQLEAQTNDKVIVF